MARLAYLAICSVVLAIIIWVFLILTPLEKYDNIERCGHDPVYRVCPWSK